jgi:hypothetical protein
MFFGAGNCLDNDSGGFHYIGYAETVSPVRSAADLLTWKVINGLDNPILSTDTVTDPSGPRPYPLNAPVVNVHGDDALSAAQVAPWVPPAPLVIPPGGYNSNFFSGRVYDPQAIWTDERILTIVFAGYNTPSRATTWATTARSAASSCAFRSIISRRPTSADSGRSEGIERPAGATLGVAPSSW